ncbi:MAG: enoyl-CoA hydratase/isomerase family protein [Betaproteobacteria bacterium]|nr:enoyl-CoA hydratase/isomerase family protein [Betaproteobacteria bacterium]
MSTYKHWRIERDTDGLHWLYFDKAGESTNTFSAEAMTELRNIVTELGTAAGGERPRGLVVLSAKDSGFIAGADVREFTAIATPEEAVALVRRGWDTFNEFAALPFPTLALIRGFCMGGGLELALACTYRIAVDEPGTRLALPEVMLGIVPGWGGMRRLPRTIGAPAALDMMLTGRTVDAKRAKRMGLVDESVPVRVMMNAARITLAARPAPHRPTLAQRLTLWSPARKIIAAQARKQTAKKARRVHYPAPYAILDIWSEHDGDPFAFPAAHASSLQSLLASPTTRNLIRLFGLQERLKAQGKESAFQAKHVHVIGAGTMGGDIAAWCALRGLKVTLQDQSSAKLAPAMGRAAKLFKDRLRDPRRIRDAADLLIPDVAGDGARSADVIIEAVFENLQVKQDIFTALEAKVRPGAILATNTSSIPIEQIAAAMRDPGRLVGLHFFNPVPKMMLVEIVAGVQSRPDLLLACASFTRQIDKLPLPVKSAPGFLVNRILAPYLMEAMACVDEGVAPEIVDEAALAFGMPMGPLELADTVGLDICLAVGKMLAPAGTSETVRPARLRQLIAEGKLGRKTGAGFYAYPGGKISKPRADPKRVPAGLADRLIAPLLAEAQRALAEGIVADADLVDAGAIFGTGFAFYTGGPLHYLAARAT